MLTLSVISILLALVYIGIISFFIYGWAKIPKNNILLKEYDTTVSIMIPVRNEENHIGLLLQDLAKQSYPSHLIEIIVIDDHSTDRTVEIVNQVKGDNVKLISLYIDQPTNAYKKKAITTAIENTSSELIITTDGDCRIGPEWVESIVSFFKTNNVKLVSSPVSFHDDNNWYEKLQTVEFQFLIGAGGACIQNKFPNTCNGANLAYTREVFEEVHGFKGIDDIAHGDDELFLHKVFHKFPNSIGFLKDERAIVNTFAKRKFGDFLQQRKRWASKSVKYYDKRMVWMVSLIFLFNLSILINGIAGFFYKPVWTLFIIQVLTKLLFDGIFIFQTLQFFKKIKLMVYVPLVVFFYVFYIIVIGIIGNIGNTYEWKGRSVR